MVVTADTAVGIVIVRQPDPCTVQALLPIVVTFASTSWWPPNCGESEIFIADQLDARKEIVNFGHMHI